MPGEIESSIKLMTKFIKSKVQQIRSVKKKNNKYRVTRMTTSISSVALGNYKQNIWKTESWINVDKKTRILSTILKYHYIYVFCSLTNGQNIHRIDWSDEFSQI